jgi:hypothetical protein
MRRWILVAVMCASASVSVTPQTPATSAFPLLTWSKERKLRKTDFKASTAKSSSVSAMSQVTIDASWACIGGRFRSTVTAVFDPNSSWWSGAPRAEWGAPSFNTSDAQLLEHEQTHFDIAEVIARELREYFANLQGVCEREGELAPLQAVVADFKQKLQDEEINYDLETAYGRDQRAQWNWMTKVRKQLAAN